jgi:4'-phosphopantetheinyl transferase EntD
MNRVDDHKLGAWTREAFLLACAEQGIEIEVGLVPESSASARGRREQESVAARALAETILRTHGVGDKPIPRHADGFPLWPTGWVGSLAHSAGWCAAALSSDRVVRGVGVDIEDPARMKPHMWAHVMTAAEQRGLESLDAASAAQRATAFFCAKEAAFKALYPLWRAAPGFLEIEIDWHGGGRFGASLNSERLAGICAEFSEIVLAVCWVAIERKP